MSINLNSYNANSTSFKGNSEREITGKRNVPSRVRENEKHSPELEALKQGGFMLLLGGLLDIACETLFTSKESKELGKQFGGKPKILNKFFSKWNVVCAAAIAAWSYYQTDKRNKVKEKSFTA